jgi:hypothetical protein
VLSLLCPAATRRGGRGRDGEAPFSAILRLLKSFVIEWPKRRLRADRAPLVNLSFTTCLSD